MVVLVCFMTEVKQPRCVGLPSAQSRALGLCRYGGHQLAGKVSCKCVGPRDGAGSLARLALLCGQWMSVILCTGDGHIFPPPGVGDQKSDTA